MYNNSQLLDNISKYASKLNFWSSTKVGALLSVDAHLRDPVPPIYEDPVTEGITVSPDCSSPQSGIYAQHKNLRMPFHFIPNCSRFRANMSLYDWIFAIFGRAVRGKWSNIEVRSWRNGPANRFLFGSFKELGVLRDKSRGAAYWNKAWRLMSSEAYIICSFNYVHHNWHKDLSWKETLKILKGVKELVNTRATCIKFHRVYIPKPNGKVRPLGVPEMSWRVYLHMLNNFVVWWGNGKEGSQHAYTPGRGVHTAWSEILDCTDEYDYIYEFDLKGFFDNVDLTALRERLISQGYPSPTANWLRRMNQSIVKLTSEDKIPEPDRKLRYNADGTINVNHLNVPGAPATDLHPGIPQSLMLEMMREDMEDLDGLSEEWILSNYETVYKKYQEYQWAALSSHNPDQPLPFEDPEQQYPKNKGVPQGAATSCGLSIQAISHLTMPEALKRLGLEGKVVMYADDGIIFLRKESDLSDVLAEFGSTGVEINYSKSGWVKRSGLWEKTLKFCGITYDGQTDSIQASTRNGATLKFDKLNQFLVHLLDRRYGDSGEIKLGGSASHIDKSPSWLGGSVKDWVSSEYLNFLSRKPLNKLAFKGDWSGYIRSSLYLDSWSHNSASDRKFFATNRRSWVRTEWPGYRYNVIRTCFGKLIENAQHRDYLKAHNLQASVSRLDSVPGLSLDHKWFTLGGVTTRIYGFFAEPGKAQARKEARAETASTRLSESIRVWEKLRVGNPYISWWTSPHQAPSSYLPTEKEVYQLGTVVGDEFQINASNASSFACSDLLERSYLWATPGEQSDRPLITHYSAGIDAVKYISRKDAEALKLKALPKRAKRLLRKMSDAFTSQFDSKPLESSFSKQS